MDLIFTGTNFFSDATTPNLGAGITLNFANVTSTTSLTANITITSAATAGPKNFSVSNSGPGGGTSGTQIFMVTNPLPALTAIAPAVGNRLQTLDVVFTGANFINGVSSVEVGSGITVVSTTIADATSLTARMTITEAAATGLRDFAVINSSPGGGTSAKRTFMVNNPAPTLASINPSGGGRGQTLDVVFTGTNFISGVTSVEVGNGVTAATPTVLSATSLRAKITIDTTATPGSRNFSVTNSGPGGGTSSSQIFTISSNRAPEIVHAPLLPQPEKQDIAIQATITDDSGTPNATLHYRAGGETVFTPVTMTNTGSAYRGVIPGSAVGSRGIEYFISATDGSLTTRAPLASNFLILVQVAALAKASAQPSGSAATAYRLISVPLQLDNPSANAALEDDLGAYDDTKWRLYGLNPDSSQDLTRKQPYRELRTGGMLSSGKSLFLIVADAGKTITIGAAKSLPIDREFQINLQKGHNFIANPFNFDLPKNKLRLQSGGAVDLQTYAGNWIVENTRLSPWEGYYLPVNNADVLVVNPNLSSSAAPIGPAKTAASEWKIRILAHCGEAADTYNFAGVSSASADGWDDHDLVEAPPIGEYVSLYFSHAEWRKVFERYREDIRSTITPNHQWRFMVESNIPNATVNLRFEGWREIDPALAVVLVDETLKYKQNLRENAVYQYQPRHLDRPNEFTLIVGKEAFVEEQTANTQGVPENFVLEQNFPNPFFPLGRGISSSTETAIRFGLPQPSAVTIKIFDLAGHEIATLLDRVELPAGRHQRVWDGRDGQGRQVVNGIYFCRLAAGNFAKAIKLMVVR
jgi:hypothetical protein